MDTTIGLKDLFYAPITEDANGYETYGTPVRLAKGITAGLSYDRNSVTIDADDQVEDELDLFKEGKISLGVYAITSEKAAVLTGADVDNNGCLIDSGNDDPPYVAIGFRALTSKGTYRYMWLYRVKFSVPGENFATKKRDGITANSPTIEGKFYPRKKPDSRGENPWRTSVTEGESNDSTTIIGNWFNSVPEPTFS